MDAGQIVPDVARPCLGSRGPCQATPSANCSASPPPASATARATSSSSTAARPACRCASTTCCPTCAAAGPGQSKIVTQRKEDDLPEIWSGVFEGKTDGTSIGILFRNSDQRSGDYGDIKDKYRPGHADFTFDAKFGFRDYRGGGRSSARETFCRVAAGAIAKKLLAKPASASSATSRRSAPLNAHRRSDANYARTSRGNPVAAPIPPSRRTDFAVGYPYVPRLGRQNAGAVEVVFGRRGGDGPASVRLGELGDGGFEIVGNVTNRYLGRVIAGAGDVNGDGLADVLIGSSTAPRKTGTPPAQVEGVVYVVFGRRDSTPVDLNNLGAGGFRIYGAPGDHAGTAVAAVGDLDGDGRPEIAVGASNASPGGRAGAGRVMIVLSSRRAGNVDLAAPGAGALEIDGAAAGDRAGYAVAGLPDVNGDGRPDVAIGAPGPAPTSQVPAANGSVGIVHVPAPDAAPVDLAALAPGQGATLAGAPGEAAGSALASVGDLNGDGIADLVVGAPYASPFGRVNAGVVYFVSGSADGSGSLASGRPGWRACAATTDWAPRWMPARRRVPPVQRRPVRSPWGADVCQGEQRAARPPGGGRRVRRVPGRCGRPDREPRAAAAGGGRSGS